MTTTNDTPPIDWPARKQRALDYMQRWRAERDEAERKRRPMKYVPYDYREDDDGQRT